MQDMPALPAVYRMTSAKADKLHEECPHARSWEHCNVCCATAAGVVPHYKVTLLPCEKVLWDPTGVVGAHKGSHPGPGPPAMRVVKPFRFRKVL